MARWTLPLSAIWLLLALTARTTDPFTYFYGWHLSGQRYVQITKLPTRDKTAIDQVLRSWEQKREPGATIIVGLDSNFERKHPGCYSVTYSTLHGYAKIYVLYAADGTCLISCDND